MADKHDPTPDDLNPLMDDFGADMFSSNDESAIGDVSDSFSGLGDSGSFGDLSGFGTDSQDGLPAEVPAESGFDELDSVAAVATDGADTEEPVAIAKGKKGAKAKKEPKPKPVKPAKTPKEPKVRPPKEPSDFNVGWIGVLCLMVVCLLAANGLIFMSGAGTSQMVLVVLMDILGIGALAVPFLLWKAGQRYTIFDVLLGISVIALVIGSSILLAELASYDFTFKSAAMILPFSTKTG